MNPSDRVVPLLDHAKETGPREWVAKCPAHDDRAPSLTVRETDDGRLLLHCFAGCATHDVLAALGLQFADLFAEPLEHRRSPVRHPFSPAAVLRAVASEAMIVAVAGSDAAAGRLSTSDRDRLFLAVQRIQEAVAYA